MSVSANDNAGDYCALEAFGKMGAVGMSNGHLVNYNGKAWKQVLLSCNLDSRQFRNINGMYFIIGSNTLLASSDGAGWKQIYSAWNYTYSIVKGRGKYIAVGKNGFILVSTDLTNWKAAAPFTGNKLNCIAWDGGKFITVGEKGVIYTSTDGEKWIKCLSPTDKDLYRIKCGNGKIVVTGYDIISSSDGVKWSKIKSLVNPTSALEFGGGKFICLSDGNSYVSKDGVLWKTSKSNYDIYDPDVSGDYGYQRLRAGTLESYDILWAENRFIFFWGFRNHWPSSSDSIFGTSSDGANWKMSTQDGLDGEVFALAYGAGKYVGVGTGVVAEGFIGTSETGKDWTCNRPYRSWFEDILFDDEQKRFVAVCNNYWDDEYCTIWISNSLSTVGASTEWKLAWNDEFDGKDGSPVDTSKWSFDTGDGSDRGQTAGETTSSNIILKGLKTYIRKMDALS